MTRKTFLQTIPLLSMFSSNMSTQSLRKFADGLPDSPRMPVLFLGHGSPMNAIEENEFVAAFRKTGRELPRPAAVLCVSAHWETRGTLVTAMEQPRTIHDFGGFPPELFAVEYPAPGAPELARHIQEHLRPTEVGLDHQWGLDHGAWSVIKHLFPEADVPVLQMSLDYRQPAAYHFELARELSWLRDKGVLIVGSGNIVHNLGRVAWNKLNSPYAYDWALEASSSMHQAILQGDFERLIQYRKQGTAYDLAIPTPEHFLPLLYALALKDERDDIGLFNDTPVGGSLYMTSVRIGF